MFITISLVRGGIKLGVCERTVGNGATSVQGYYTRTTLVELKGDCAFYFISYGAMVTVIIIGATFVIQK